MTGIHQQQVPSRSCCARRRSSFSLSPWSLMGRARMRISCFPSDIAFSKPCISLCSRQESSHCEMVIPFSHTFSPSIYYLPFTTLDILLYTAFSLKNHQSSRSCDQCHPRTDLCLARALSLPHDLIRKPLQNQARPGRNGS